MSAAGGAADTGLGGVVHGMEKTGLVRALGRRQQ
jgi:hypothetical protein